MKRLLQFITIVFLSITLCFISLWHKVYAASIEDNSVIILSGEVSIDNKLIIKATMTENTGISGMTLELSYDSSVMTLSNLEFGQALSKLEPITTNPQTEKGYGITPFRINYLAKENDFTTGLMFTLTFDLFENIPNGNYIITLKYEKNNDVNYYDENKDVKTKNLFIDYAEVKIENNAIKKVISVPENEIIKPNSNTWIIVLSISVGGALLIGTSIFVILKIIKRKKKWKRI
jgi:hypothetical protein